MEADNIPYELVVKNSTNQEIKLKNILIGEVYLASGQSNMEMPLWSNRCFWKSYKGDEAVKNANFPQIRFVLVDRRVELQSPTIENTAKWQVISPETATPCSAVAYYFAKEMQRNLNVPIGLINSYWGGTLIEPWISEDAFKKNNDSIALEKLAEQKTTPDDVDKNYPELLKDWVTKFHESNPMNNCQNREWTTVDYDDSNWGKIDLPNIITYVPGIKQLRKVIEIPSEMANKDLILSLGVIDDCDTTFFNSEVIGKTFIDTPNYYDVPREYQIPANLVKAGKNIIAVRLENHYAAGWIKGKNEEITLSTADGKSKINLNYNWTITDEFIADIQKLGLRPTQVKEQQQNWFSTLYNGMINPWIIYPIRGVIWYQGCSNGSQYERYKTLFPMLINDWREKWNNPEMSFNFVQLSAFSQHIPATRGDEDAWKNVKPLYASGEGYAKIREAQMVALDMSKVGMAVSIDKGDQYDIHPMDKEPLGYRLAQEEMRISFGKKGITASPYYKEMKIDGNKIKLFFDNADNGFAFAGDKINGFAIGDDQNNWAIANVEIINGNELLVSSSEIQNPTRVRYAFCAYPGDLNLYNVEGFPMCPFRTDKNN
jgi:sialate O-acetylesterase